MQAIIGDYLTQTTLGALQTHYALGMFPLLAERDFAPEQLTLDEALEAELLRVREVSESGGVPTASRGSIGVGSRTTATPVGARVR